MLSTWHIIMAVPFLARVVLQDLTGCNCFLILTICLTMHQWYHYIGDETSQLKLLTKWFVNALVIFNHNKSFELFVNVL